ncbi:hypothetical protein IWQ62_005149 [Dispira parvispora]|uniref:Uncharacterized protein n=1 Tax=Dispira parvispora TaxID=1520584 RepID=A0A9W8ARE3_9FUNG|nr:hypothetical protein IWQ62_005149 [Dispira parvispora]
MALCSVGALAEWCHDDTVDGECGALRATLKSHLYWKPPKSVVICSLWPGFRSAVPKFEKSCFERSGIPCYDLDPRKLEEPLSVAIPNKFKFFEMHPSPCKVEEDPVQKSEEDTHLIIRCTLPSAVNYFNRRPSLQTPLNSS